VQRFAIIAVNHTRILAAGEPKIVRLILPFSGGFEFERRKGSSVEFADPFARTEVEVPRFVLLNAADAVGEGLSSHATRNSSTKMEKKLQSLWGGVLGLPEISIGADDSFFRIGGDAPPGGWSCCCVCNRRLAHSLPHGCNVMPTVED
jgi:hypothetical protein